MNSRSTAAFVLKWALLAITTYLVITYHSQVTGRLPADRAVLAVLIFAPGIALVYLLLSQLIDDSLNGGERRQDYNLLQLMEALGLRTAGKSDVQELAAATAAVLDMAFKTPRLVWLLLKPEEAGYAVQPVVGRGQPVEPVTLTRANPLLRLLDMQRKPVLHADLLADPRYAQTAEAERQWLAQLEVEVYAPIVDAGALTAILAIGPKNRRPGQLRPADLELLMILATQAGTAFKTARVIADLRRVNESVSSLNVSLHETMEALSKMDAARSDFLAIASHELRTPINQLLGFADLLDDMAQDNALDPAMVADITSSIVRACGRLDDVIRQMLEMAELDVNAMDINYGDTTVEQILRLAIEPYGQALRDRRLALSAKGLRNLPPLRADEPRLVRAFSQLVSNAIKFTPDGGRIEIDARLLPQENEQPLQVEVVVADSGIGIDAKHHALIFQKFYRVGSAAIHSTGTTKFMGAGPGLGLPIAKGVIERHGGSIRVESPGHDPVRLPGSRFTVVLPVRPPAFGPRALEQLTTSQRESRKEVTIVPGKSPFIGMDG